jgi:hypothetical protein
MCVCNGCRAVYPKGVGAPGLARYLQEANKEVEVWLQVRRGTCVKTAASTLGGVWCWSDQPRLFAFMLFGLIQGQASY